MSSDATDNKTSEPQGQAKQDTETLLSFTIRLSTGTRWDLVLDSADATVFNTTVLKIKELLLSSSSSTGDASNDYLKDCTVDRMRLIFKGRILENDRVLSDYGIEPSATLFLVKSAAAATTTGTAGAPATKTTATTPAAKPPATAPATVSSTASSSIPTSGAFPMFPGMMMPGAAATGTNNNGFPPPPNPQQMQQMLNNPLFQNLLEGQPDVLRQMMQSQAQSNPALQRMMDSNPALAHVMNDPAAWQQAVEMMRNPAAMQQALRQQDLAMSQLENMPGGMAALSNLYTQYQQPLEESLLSGNGSGSTNNNGTNNDQDRLAGATGQAMPNPWGSNTARRTTNRPPSSSGTASNNPWASLGGGGGSSIATTGGASSSTPGRNNNNNTMDLFNNMMMSQGGGAGGGGIPGLFDGGGFGMPPGGLGMPPGGMMTPEQRQQMLQMLDNPVITQMMQTALQQDPALFRNMIMQQNPALGQMLGNNPEALDRMIQQMMNPDTLRAVLQLQDQLQGVQLGGGPSTSPANPSSSTAPRGSAGLDFGNLLFGGAPIGGAPPNPFLASGAGSTPNFPLFVPPALTAPAPVPPQNPAERYAVQLQSLYGMGFDDELRNLEALQASAGNLNRAVDYLLSMPPPPPLIPSSPAPAATNTTDSASQSSPQQPEQQQPSSSSSNPTPDDQAPTAPKDAHEKKND